MKNYPKCILEEEIKDSNRINEQVNIFLIKIFSMKDDKDEFYKNCQEFKEEEEVIEGFCNNKDKIYKDISRLIKI